jgi:hypothetical protein
MILGGRLNGTYSLRFVKKLPNIVDRTGAMVMSVGLLCSVVRCVVYDVDAIVSLCLRRSLREG